MSVKADTQTPSLSELPRDELVSYGRELGLHLPIDMPRGELLRRIRAHREMLVGIDRDALLDVVVWARRPVRRSAGKEALAREIAQITNTRFETLSDRGLRTLASLRGLQVFDSDPREQVERRLRRSEGIWSRFRRARRAVVGGLVSKIVERETAGEYRFLPEDHSGPTLAEEIKDQGVVGGIARKLRGVADDYVREKLDEIETRIDRKLDEIDQRLSEWRDREITNRLRILKITLLVSILVAIICLSYDLLAGWIETGRPSDSNTGSDVRMEAPHANGDNDSFAEFQDAH